jgi:hypothetical protein
VTFALGSSSTGGPRFASREDADPAHRPRLVLDRGDAADGGPSTDSGPTTDSGPLPDAGGGGGSGPPLAALCGTWVLQQVQGASEITGLKSRIFSALDVPGTIGFSVRFPWNAADLDGGASTNAVLDASRSLVDDYNSAHPGSNKRLAIRLMAGRHTPARVFAAGAAFYTLPSGEKVPKAWSNADTQGAPFQANVVFEQAWGAYAAKLATWSRAHDVNLLHLSWYGQDWAELNHGAEVRAAAGYSYERWLEGHKRLIAIAAQQSGPSLAVELPASGYGPLSGGQSASLADEVIAQVGPNSSRFFIQANGWGPAGDWGAPSVTVEAQFDAIWSKRILRGVQMIQPEDYDWASVFGRITSDEGANRASGASYTEIYLPSFSGANAAQLRTQIQQFSSRCPK